MSKGFQWSSRPSKIGNNLSKRMAGVPVALAGLARVKAAAGEATMKGGAGWNDITGFARGALYGRAELLAIHLGTTNDEYGLFLEVGTIKMAARPIIKPTLDALAPEYFEDACRLVERMLGGR